MNIKIGSTEITKQIEVSVHVLRHRCGYGEVYRGHEVRINDITVQSYGLDDTLSLQENLERNARRAESLGTKIALALIK